MSRINLAEGDSWIEIREKVFADKVDDTLFEELWNLHPTEYGKVMMFGNLINTPRWQQSYGLPYYFSGLTHAAKPIPHPFIESLKELAEKETGLSYKQVLLNWYLPEHYVGSHADSESQLVPNTPIYSFSFGEQRVFRIRSKSGKQIDGKKFLDIKMPHGTLLIMGGEMQKYYKHEVPKSTKYKSKRINVTIRCFKETNKTTKDDSTASCIN